MESARTTKLYNAVLEKNWKTFDEQWNKYQEDHSQIRDADDLMDLIRPVSMQGDSIFHLAVYSKEPLLDKMLNFAPSDAVRNMMVDMSLNKYGNTVLHEAAISGNLEAATLLVDQYRLYKLLEKQNDAKETPLFMAAANGKTNIVKYLAAQPGQIVLSDDDKRKLKDTHRKNKKGDSVLFVAIQGQHFGTAIELLKLDEELANLVNEENGITCLYMLAKIPSALRSGKQIGIWKNLVFSCLPARDIDDYNDDADQIEIKGLVTKLVMEVVDDWRYLMDAMMEISMYSSTGEICDLLRTMEIDKGSPPYKKVAIEKFGISSFHIAKNIWKEKRKHEFADKLAKKLTKRDKSWEKLYGRSIFSDFVEEEEQGNQLFPGNVEVFPQQLEQLNLMLRNILHVAAKEEPENPLFADIVKIILEKYPQQLEKLNHKILLHEAAKEQEEESEIPLFAAIRAGNVELVKLILKTHPHQLEGLNGRRQNILQLAAMYRQKEIFDFVKSKEIPIFRMARQIDKDGCTVLHSVADTKHYKGGTRSGPAYQLQEELEWFSDVMKIIPSNYTILVDRNKKTAEEILKEKHAEQLKSAQSWIKDTSQSCSAVAVLVATVVFAAAFTVPGGNNEANGLPVLLNSPMFLFFTTVDVIALSCSLTSVVMFLSILTSPFELENFRASLPRRLTFGFAFLFIAVAATMLAFASTIFLIIRETSRRWMLTFISSAAFFPVSMLALTHFRLFVSFITAWKK